MDSAAAHFNEAFGRRRRAVRLSLLGSSQYRFARVVLMSVEVTPAHDERHVQGRRGEQAMHTTGSGREAEHDLQRQEKFEELV